MSPPLIPTLEPKFFFGLTTQVNGNCLFLTENEIVYPASGVLVIYDISHHKQKYIQLVEPQKVITAMALCINKYDRMFLNDYFCKLLQAMQIIVIIALEQSNINY